MMVSAIGKFLSDTFIVALSILVTSEPVSFL